MRLKPPSIDYEDLKARNFRQIVKGWERSSDADIAVRLGTNTPSDFDEAKVAEWLAALDLRVVPSFVAAYEINEVEAMRALAHEHLTRCELIEVTVDELEVTEDGVDLEATIHRKAVQRLRRNQFSRRRPELVIALQKRDGYVCKSCGVTTSLTVDHVLPLSLGGTDDLENLQFLCGPCNSSKGARELKAVK